MKKIKVVLLSHYWSNQLNEMTGANCLNHAPWIQETINLFENKDDIELHVVAPNYGKNTKQSFFKNNIHYHLYKYTLFGIPKLILYLVNLFTKHKKSGKSLFRFNTLTFYIYTKIKIYLLIKSINPDLIHLYGSENLDYSVGALPFLKNKAVLLTIQGYVCKGKPLKGLLNKYHHKLRVSVENQINKSISYITANQGNYFIKQFNNQPICFVEIPPLTVIPNIEADKVTKEYDIVFYSRVTQQKGIEDLILAISQLKNNGILFKVYIIGSTPTISYLEYLKELINKNGISDLITFSGFIPNHEDLFKEAAKARVIVLPTHEDFFNNTVREAMFMRLPVIVNDVHNMSEANKHNECITLTKCGDIEDLVKKIKLVLTDKERTNKLIENAYNEMYSHYSPDKIYSLTIDTYQKVLLHYNMNLR